MMNRKSMIIFVAIAGLLPALIFMVLSSNVKACDCAILFEGEYNPENIQYTDAEINEDNKKAEDAEKFVELGRECVLQYGDLDKVEEELTKAANSLDVMPKIDEAIANAKIECNE